jgi:hypothetical protein
MVLVRPPREALTPDQQRAISGRIDFNHATTCKSAKWTLKSWVQTSHSRVIISFRKEVLSRYQGGWETPQD